MWHGYLIITCAQGGFFLDHNMHGLHYSIQGTICPHFIFTPSTCIVSSKFMTGWIFLAYVFFGGAPLKLCFVFCFNIDAWLCTYQWAYIVKKVLTEKLHNLCFVWSSMNEFCIASLLVKKLHNYTLTRRGPRFCSRSSFG